MLGDESAKELQARQSVESRLQPGEQLLEYTRFDRVTNSRHSFFVGLTTERLVLLPIKKGAVTGAGFGIGRSAIRSIVWRAFPWQRLKVKLLQDQLELRINAWFSGGHWRNRAKELAIASQAHATAVALEPQAARQRQLDQIQALQALGFLATARAQLENILQSDSDLVSDPRAAVVATNLSEMRRRHKAAAALLFGDVAILAMLTTLVFIFEGSRAFAMIGGASVISSIADIVIGVALWREHTSWDNWAIVRAIVGIVAACFDSLPKADYAWFLSQLASSASMLIVLTGKATRRRVWIGISLYLVGYPGLLTLQLVSSFLSPFFRK